MKSILGFLAGSAVVGLATTNTGREIAADVGKTLLGRLKQEFAGNAPKQIPKEKEIKHDD